MSLGQLGEQVGTAFRLIPDSLSSLGFGHFLGLDHFSGNEEVETLFGPSTREVRVSSEQCQLVQHAACRQWQKWPGS